MEASSRLRPHRALLFVLLAVTCVPAAALAWVSWRMLQQDRALAVQRLDERLEYAADPAALALERRLHALQEGLPSRPSAPAALPDDAIVLAVHGGSVETSPPLGVTRPPETDLAPEPPPETWAAGERLEYQDGDFAAAAAEFRALTTSSRPEVQAGAWVRTARALRKAGRHDEARSAYDELARLDRVSVGGAPAGLVAAYGRTLLLRDRPDRPADWHTAAATFAVTLLRPSNLDRPTFAFYAGELRTWLAADASSGVVGLDRPEGHTAVVWRASSAGLTLLVGGPQYVAAHVFGAIQQPRLRIEIADDGTSVATAARGPVAVRRAADTGLPWTLRVRSVDPTADLDSLSMPRGLLFAGIGLIAVVVAAGVYAVTRAIARELAVAQLQSNFVTAVSHEFRSPVTALRHLTEMLATGAITDGDRIRQYHAALAREAERLERLVDGLLDFGRMEAGRREYRFDTVDAGALVDEVVADFTRDEAVAARRIEVAATALDAGDRAVRGDSGALGRAVWNLLDNALKYSPAHSPVRVALARDNGRLLISVADQGPGIPAAERAQLFERFVRGSAAASVHAGGTGLGLAIVRHIARAHGGDVSVDSEPGRGSRFTIALPAGGPSST